jgi:hypothetical protein
MKYVRKPLNTYMFQVVKNNNILEVMKMNNIQDAGRVQQGGSGRELLQAGTAGGSSSETSAKSSQEKDKSEPVDFYISLANEDNDDVMFSEWENLLSYPELEESDRINPQIKMWNEPGTFEDVDNGEDFEIQLRNDEAGITVNYSQVEHYGGEILVRKEVNYDASEDQHKNLDVQFMPYATIPKPFRLYGEINTDKNEDSKPLELEIGNLKRQKVSVLGTSNLEFLFQPGEKFTEIVKVDSDFNDETKDTYEVRSKDQNTFITYTEGVDPENENQILMTKDVKFADDSDKDFHREEVRPRYSPFMDMQVDGEAPHMEASAETQEAGMEGIQSEVAVQPEEEPLLDVYVPVSTARKSGALNMEWDNLENIAALEETGIVNPRVEMWPSKFEGKIEEYNNNNPDSSLEKAVIRDDGSEATITFSRQEEGIEKRVEHDNDFHKHRDFTYLFNPNAEFYKEPGNLTLNLSTEKEESDIKDEWNSLKSFPAINMESNNEIQLQPTGGTAQLITYDITDNPDTSKRLEVKDYENGVTLSYTAEMKDEETAEVIKEAEFKYDEDKNYSITEEIPVAGIFPGSGDEVINLSGSGSA